MWYVFQTMTGEENISLEVCKQKIKKEFYKEMFIPKYIARKKFKGKWHDVEKPLFPGYFFVDTNQIEEVLKQISKVKRLTKALCNAEKVSPIEPEEEKYLRNIMDKNYIVQISTGLIIGTKIVVTDGALQDYQGRICKIDRHRRIAKIETSMFGKNTPVEIGLEVVKKVSDEEFEAWKKEQAKIFPNMEELSEGEKQIEPGSLVRIQSGTFQNLVAKVKYFDNSKEEIHTILPVMGMEMPVTFQIDEVEVV